MQKERKKKRREEKASPDLTPMIDVTFQLLIFFILVTRFKTEERNHQVELPKDEGDGNPRLDVPKEQITIYSQWDAASQANHYVVGIGARGRVPVQDSYASLGDLVIFPNDGPSAVLEKKRRYAEVFDGVVNGINDYIVRSGAKIDKLEISFAVDATEGVRSGTAPWMFVSLAIDAAAKVNQLRAAEGKEELPVTFKFADALGHYD